MLNKPVLLALLLGLLLIRFVGLPIIEAQEAKRAELELVTSQLDRALEAVDELPTLKARLEQQAEENAAWRDVLPQARSVAELRLQMQQKVQQSLNSNAVEITLFNWLGELEENSDDLRVLRARLTVRTDAVPLFDASLALLEDIPNLKFEEIELQRQIQRRRGGTRYQATLLITVIGRVEG